MNFLNPAILFGLIAAIIPVLLHLLNLRKLKTVEFSTLFFLKELKKTQIKKLKLRQLIILILRILIIVFIVFAFARPVIQNKLPIFQSYAKSSAVILFDNSISMNLSDEHGTRFNQAKYAALKVIDNLSDGSEISIINMTTPSLSETSNLSRNYSYLKQNIENLKIDYLSTKLSSSLKVAYAILEDAKNVNKEIFIISDMQNNIFDTTQTIEYILDNKNIRVYIIPMGANTENINNMSIDSLKVISQIFRKDKSIEVESVISNHSDYDSQGLVVSLLFNKQRVAQRTIDIPAGKQRKIKITGVPEEVGAINAEITIEGDGLDEDNYRYFGFILPEKIKTAVFSENNKFIHAFFSGIDNVNSVNNTTFINPNDIPNTDLENYDVITLFDGDYSKTALDLIKNYISNGGKAVVFPNTKVNFAVFSEFISDFGFSNIIEYNYDNPRSLNFDDIDKLHPLFEGVFQGNIAEKKTITPPELKKVFLVNGGYKIINTKLGAFLAESQFGKGKVIYCATGITSEWGNFAIKPLFPILLYRSIVYLNSSDLLSQQFYFDNNISIKLLDEFASFSSCKIIDPNGNNLFANIISSSSNTTAVTNNISLIGNYSILSKKNRITNIFSVNINPTESLIKKYDNDFIIKNLEKRIIYKDNIEYIEDAKNINEKIIKARLGTEIWKIFVLLALMASITELFISRSGSVK